MLLVHLIVVYLSTILFINFESKGQVRYCLSVSAWTLNRCKLTQVIS